MMPGAALTLLFGVWLAALNGWGAYMVQTWFQLKLLLLLVLVVYHIYCGKLLKDFKNERNTHSHLWYRWFNEVPVIFLIAIILLAVYKPL